MGPAWPLNRRVLYNRASADINGKPWDPKRMLIQWNGSKWTGNDIPDFGNAAPGTPTGPFIMQPEGMGRLFAINKMAEGPFPEHYEPIETPLGTNPLHPNVVSNPVVRLYEQDALRMGKKEQFPYVGTTYRLTEHFHTGPSTHCSTQLLSRNSLWKSAKRWRRRKALPMAIVSLSPASVALSARWLW
ncbi:hypothetical protein ECZU51_20650 [Escherichia coli]|nr:hypothetical protein ECZU51_20650 [Escherichia coli]